MQRGSFAKLTPMATAPWQVAPPPDVAEEAAAQPTADELAKQLAVVGKRPVHLGPEDLSDSDSEPDSEEEERLRPPGPPDPEKCVVRRMHQHPAD